ncbi:hypothetical protein PR048_031536 [Dryococelus australis]|uniref:Uncharacterized protein n=1 Tax=Dryococelus australis TaxID=614101 RepID=A0ABQ9G8I9_9NEOP|nr:hypothetical protein PR048_031536 [Dryococelus australis]
MKFCDTKPLLGSLPTDRGENGAVGWWEGEKLGRREEQRFTVFISRCVIHCDAESVREESTRPLPLFAPGNLIPSKWVDYSPPTKAHRDRFPEGSLPGFSHVGIVPDDAASGWVFLGISHLPFPCIPALVHTHLASPSSALKTSLKVYCDEISIHIRRCIVFRENDFSFGADSACKYGKSQIESTTARTQSDTGKTRASREDAEMRGSCPRRRVSLHVLSRHLLVGPLGDRNGVVVRLLAPHPGEPGSITGGAAPGFSHVGIVPKDAANRQVFRLCYILASPSSALKTSIAFGCCTILRSACRTKIDLNLALADEVNARLLMVQSDIGRALTVFGAGKENPTAAQHRCNSAPPHSPETVKGHAYLEICSVSETEKRGINKGYIDTRIECAIIFMRCIMYARHLEFPASECSAVASNKAQHRSPVSAW